MKYRDNMPEESESDRSVVTRTAVEIAERHKAALELPDMEPPEL